MNWYTVWKNRRKRKSRQRRAKAVKESEALEFAMVAEGFDEAIIGLSYRASRPPVIAYDYWICIDILQEQGRSKKEAVEYLEHKVIDAWVGDGTPCFIAGEKD